MDYTKYERCEFCGGYDIPDSECEYVVNGVRRYHFSMQCNGIRTWGTNPYAEEIKGDTSLYFECQGERHQSAMDI